MIVSLSDLPNIFDFAFNPYALLSLIAAAACLVVIFLVFSEGINVSVNRWYSYSIITLFIWAVTEAFSRLSVTPYAAIFWETLGSIGWIFVAPLFFAFAISYIGKEKLLSKFSWQSILFGPAFTFLFLSWATGLVVNQNPTAYVKYATDWMGPLDTPLFGVVFAYIDILLIASLFLILRFYLKTKDLQVRRQSFLIVCALLIPLIGGSITNGILPVLGINVIRLAVPLTTIMSVIIAYAILRYRLFAISPGMIVSNIVETMNEILIVFNKDHYIEFVNDAVERVLGYKKAELTGQPIKKLVSSDWNNFQEKVLQPIDQGKQVSGVDINLESANGQKIPVSFSSSALRNPRGEIYGEVGIATDIRKIRELITDTIAERNKLTTVMQSIVDGVFALSSKGDVILINPAALNMLGLNEKDILGKNLDEVLTMLDADKRLKSANLLPNKNLDKDTILIQKRGLEVSTKFGKRVFVNLTSSGIREGVEVGLGAIITISDVSKEKELEEMKLDFVSMAAHELRTPLTAIRGYLSVLQEETAKSLDKEQKSFLDKAFISSSQLAALVENLLSVAKIERGAMKLEVEPTDWPAVLNEIVENFLSIASEKRVNLSIGPLPDLPKVLVDKFRITEVLANLIANATNYTKPGGNVVINAEVINKEVVTHIKDTGQGIPEGALTHMFTKFFRVSGVLEQGSKGTGLGLYISKAIIDMHQGRIWVESKMGVGSTFSFSVPIAEEQEKPDLDKKSEKETVIAPALVTPNKKAVRYFKKKPG